MRKLVITLFLLFKLANQSFDPVVENAQTDFSFTGNEPFVQFPESIQFTVRVTAPSEIERVELEYYADHLSCGNVIAKGLPDFTPSNSVKVYWTWEMRQSGSLPPGATIHWRWRVFTTDGKEAVSDEKEILWQDPAVHWKTLSDYRVNLHWYAGEQRFGTELQDAAINALSTIEGQIGLKPNNPIDVYIYADNMDFQDAILYEPGWTGGIAVPEYDIVLIGISPDNLAWGKTTIAHEIAHVLQGQYSFTCLGDTPTWLMEGIAMYAEGGLETSSTKLFEKAIREDTLLSVKALSGSFSENPDKADLSYSQSYSLVNFLIEQYGKEKLLELMDLLKEGTTVDDALEKTYGFDIEGFETTWRAGIGAKPRQEGIGFPTPTAAATHIPTIVPLGSGQGRIESIPGDAQAEPVPGKTLPPFVLGIIVGVGFILLVLIIFLVIILARRRKSSHE